MTDTTDIEALRNAVKAAADCGYVHPVYVDGRFLKSLLDQLESEIQWTEELKQMRDSWRESAYRNTHRAEKAEAEIAALKAKLANPVVLPELCSVVEGEYADSPQITPDPDGYLFYSHKVIESIIIAGFTVKGEG